jgi:hypothetical protein
MFFEMMRTFRFADWSAELTGVHWAETPFNEAAGTPYSERCTVRQDSRTRRSGARRRRRQVDRGPQSARSADQSGYSGDQIE